MTLSCEKPKYRKVADCGLLVEYGAKIDPQINQKVQGLRYALESKPLVGIIEIIPAYCSLFIIYDPLTVKFDALEIHVSELDEQLTDINIPAPETIHVPVCYGGEFGPDLERVGEHNGISDSEVIRIHSESSYLIYMLGFTPGFPFLGGLSKKLHTPRLESPRPMVPAGSVGIANGQTGIYPIESPGGWQLIGRTPAKLFDPTHESPFLLRAGDMLKFKPISEDEFYQLLEGNVS